MTQQLGALDGPLEDLGSLSTMHMTVCNSSFRGSMSPGMHVMHIYMHAGNTHTHKVNLKIKQNKKTPRFVCISKGLGTC